MALWFLPSTHFSLPFLPYSAVFALLVIRLKSSKRLALTLTLAHFTATGLMWPLDLHILIRLSGTLLLAASLAFYVKRYAWLTSPRSVTGLELLDDMTCVLKTRQGKSIACALLGSSFVAPYLTVLEFKPLESLPPWQTLFASHSIVIFPDGINAEDFRKLRVLLRWKWKDSKGPD